MCHVTSNQFNPPTTLNRLQRHNKPTFILMSSDTTMRDRINQMRIKSWNCYEFRSVFSQTTTFTRHIKLDFSTLACCFFLLGKFQISSQRRIHFVKQSKSCWDSNSILKEWKSIISPLRGGESSAMLNFDMKNVRDGAGVVHEVKLIYSFHSCCR